MKSLPPAMVAALASGVTTFAYCWRVTRRDGTVLGFTEHDRDLVYAGTTFSAETGFHARRRWHEHGGQKAMAAAFPVAIASDQSAVPVTIGKAASAGDTSVTTGGTAQTLFSGVTPANGWKVANPDVAEDLWVSDSVTAAPNGQGSYRVPAGGIVTTEAGERPGGPVSIYGATTGHLITARAW